MTAQSSRNCGHDSSVARWLGVTLSSSGGLHFVPAQSPHIAYARCEPLGHLLLLSTVQPKAKRPGSCRTRPL